MKKITLILFALLISSGTLLGCNPRRTVSIGEAENGKTVELNAGDTLTISLAGNPTTGYNWYVASVDANILKQQGEPVFSASSNLVGAGGTLTLTFQAALAGQTSLVLDYKRIWETGVPPAQIYSVTVVVK